MENEKRIHHSRKAGPMLTVMTALTLMVGGGDRSSQGHELLNDNFSIHPNHQVLNLLETNLKIYAMSFSPIKDNLLSPPKIETSEAEGENREDCKVIKGSDYLSQIERNWYLENCKLPVINAGPNLGFHATHYGVSYNGGSLGCGTGEYSSTNERILAAPPARDKEWPCGTVLRITNPANGQSIEVERHDSCPGCGPNTVDLSESGLDILCGKKDCNSVSGLIIEVVKDRAPQSKE